MGYEESQLVAFDELSTPHQLEMQARKMSLTLKLRKRRCGNKASNPAHMEVTMHRYG